MKKILLISSDFNTDVIPIWKGTWDVLKKNHPKIKVSVFVVPFWKSDFQKDIVKNVYFKEWYKERKNWVEIGQQGYTNSYPPECTRFKKPQGIILKRGYRKLSNYMPQDFYYFKPSYDRMDDNITINILKNLGFSACIWNKSIIMLKKCDNPISEDCEIIQTKINIEERNPDDIKVLFKKLDDSFYEFEQQDCEFITFRDLIYDCFKKEKAEVEN
ncbi:MAG: hypothetical protein Q7R52_02640 [archaeon]|nr:hypothetical protein [archaeon]